MRKLPTYFTIIGCMDGRVHLPVLQFGQKLFNAEYGDVITEAGFVEFLQVNPFDDFMENFKKKVNISVDLHASRGILVFGHEDCAGNPVENDLHKSDVLKTASFIQSFVQGLNVVPVFVWQKEGSWKVISLK